MEVIRVSWVIADGVEPAVDYLVNGAPVGEGQSGLDRVINLVGANPLAQVVLEVRRMGLGGESLLSALPFADQYAKFADALGDRQPVVEFH